MEKSKGITLIALIITIIILLILAGITIISLAESGLLAKSGEAKERTIKAQLKEEIEMAIQEIQIEELPKGNNVTLESLANVQLVAKLKEITTDLGTDKITGEYKDYDYIITGEYEVVIGNKLLGEKPTITHTVDTEQIGVTQVVITVNASVSDGTIVEIVKPDGSIEQNVGQATFTVNKSGKYVFTAKSSNGRRLSYTVKITNILPSAPVIESQGGYPILTVYGVQNTQGKVTITYEDNEVFVNSYSEDNGTTWKEYTGPFEPMASTIVAKSEYRDDSTIKVEATKKVVVDDALSPEVYDGDESTIGCVGTTQYLIVDNEIQGKKIKVYVGSKTGAYCETYIYSINSLGEEVNLVTVNSNNTKDIIVTIPDECVKMKFVARWGDAFNHAYFREVSICNEPIIQENKNYPILTANGVINLTSKIDINYFPTSERKLYKIDEGEWQEYTETITVDVGSTVYAKGIDANGKETRMISECIASLESDALDIAVYDGDEKTIGCKGITQYLVVDNEVRGRNMNVFVGATSGAYCETYIYSINSSGEEVNLATINSNNTYSRTIEIPSDCVKMKFVSKAYAYFREIRLLD